ncbi:IS3 family transposase [Leptospira vanthielii]|uniref:Integrase core domain protein n=2 Tax=Leptospira vanthielii serovar Holland str. Waz Holland = ATCC 700522 TaxID=1218591 RepID=N1W167_9LEPT|nr:IS3 family transposase [Leptospira vanthielii]EMY69959.1 integrase core domain protein [Leptospira vanthielii serovar Holland str. Waz Holland = ATCC 700522]
MKEHRESFGFSIKVMSEVLDIKHKGFYPWLKKSKSIRNQKSIEILYEIRKFHKGDLLSYGSPRVQKELRARGIKVSLPTVAKIMRENGIKAITTRKFKHPVTTNSNHEEAISPNLLEQNFQVSTPNTVYVTDITYIPYLFGFLYLCKFKDICTKKIVGWAVDTHMKTSLVMRALENAVENQKPNEGLIIHSDRGSQYASKEFCENLTSKGFIQSMSRKGNCWDNAPAESFFATLKREFTNHKNFHSLEQAQSSLFEYIEVFYNRKRLHSKIGYKSPVTFENEFYAYE